jgi:arylsulfatase A-like enzyme
LVVLASDHGEAFGEHGHEGHARDVNREVTTTPLIMSFPFQLAGGIVVEAPAENVDIWPTLLDLLKLPPLNDPDGISRVPEIMAAAEGRTDPLHDRPRFAHIDENWGRTENPERPMVAVSDGPYRLVIGGRSGRAFLYDRTADPTEQNDLSEEQPELLARMRDLAKDYLERPPAPWGAAPEAGIDAGELDQLRALGYSVQ